jgi:hypothetical protein
MVNPRMLELEVAKEILAELFDIRTNEVDEMIWQIMEERILYGREFSPSPRLATCALIFSSIRSLLTKFFPSFVYAVLVGPAVAEWVAAPPVGDIVNESMISHGLPL